VIVGGGFTGLWAAHQLLDRGASVALLDAGVCGEGPSGRNGGFVDHLGHAAPRLRAIGGDAGAGATVEESLDSVRAIGAWCDANGVDAWFRPAGQIVASTAVAHDGGEAETMEALTALGFGDELVALTPEEVRRRCASPLLRGGTLVRSTATVHPARLGRGLRARLVERGARVFEHARVTALRDEPAGVVAATAGGRVRAGAAILATGAWSARLPPLRRRLTVTSSHIVLTEPVPDVLEELGWTGGEAITDSRRLVHYFRTTDDGRILFGWGGGRIACGGRIGAREELDAGVVAQTATDLHAVFPRLAGRRIEHAWGGPIDASPAHLPIVDTLAGNGRTHVAFGYTGNGVGPSHLCGRILASLALDERDALTRLPIVGARDRLLPPEPLRVAGGAAIRRALDSRERAEQAGRRVAPLARAVSAIPNLLGVQIGR